MIKTFYIYEVVGRKVGCTNNWKGRRRYNFNRWLIEPIILETYEYPDTEEYWQILGDREWELADLKGYDRGVHYKSIRERAFPSGRRNVESGHLRSISSNGGKSHRKLTFQEAEEIRELYANGNILQKDLAKRYSLSVMSISYIVNRKRYNEA